MANINFSFGADASKVDRALEGLSKKLDSIILKGTQSEGVLEKAFEQSAQKAVDLQQKIDGIGSAFQRMQAQTSLNNLRANLNTGVLDQFVTKLNQMGVSSERNTTYVRNLAASLGLTRNQLQSLINSYSAYAATLRIGSEEYINAVANLKILQNTFSELDQSISVSGQNMRSQINNTEAGIRSMGANLNAIPQQLQDAFSNLSLSRDVLAGSRMFSAVLSQNNGDVLKAIRYVQEYSQTSVDELYRNGVISLQQVKDALTKLRAEIAENGKTIDTTNMNWLSDAANKIKNALFEKQLSNIAEFEQTLGAKLSSVEDKVITSDAVIKKGFNPFTEIVAEQKLSINELTALLNRLQQTYNNLSPDDKNLKKYELAIQAVNSQLQHSTQSTMGGTLALQQLGFAIGDAGMMLTNFRGALMGIGNNLPFVIQGFMQLKQEVAAINASGAVQTTVWKQLVSSLKGPAGILLAVNLGIALFTIFGDKIGEWIGVTSKAADAAQAYKDAIKKAQESMLTLNAFKDANIGKSITEITSLQALAAEYDNINTSLSRKKQILSEIQRQHPEVIRTLDAQKGAEKSLKKAIEETTKSLYNKLKQQLIEIFLAPEYLKVSEAMARYNDETAKMKNMMADPKNNSAEAITQQIKYADIAAKAVQTSLKNYDHTLKKVTGNVDAMLKKFIGIAGGTAVNTDYTTSGGNTGGSGGKGGSAADEYTAIEKLNNEYSKKIAKETDALKIVMLRIELNDKVWAQVKKQGGTQEVLDEAEIKFLEKKKDLEGELKNIADEKLAKSLEEQSARINRDSRRRQEFTDIAAAEADAETQFINRLIDIQRSIASEGLNRWSADFVDLNADFEDQKTEIMKSEIYNEAQKLELIGALEREHGQKRIALEKRINAEKLDIISGFLSASASLFGRHTAAYAILAAAQATMDTYKAANIALSTYPPPFSYIAMGTAIASGLANVKEIWNALPDMPKFARGGLVDSPTVGLMGEAGPELIAPQKDFMWYSKQLLASAGRGSGDRELVATVKGGDLVIMLQKAERKMNRQKIGGTV